MGLFFKPIKTQSCSQGPRYPCGSPSRSLPVALDNGNADSVHEMDQNARTVLVIVHSFMSFSGHMCMDSLYSPVHVIYLPIMFPRKAASVVAEPISNTAWPGGTKY